MTCLLRSFGGCMLALLTLLVKKTTKLEISGNQRRTQHENKTPEASPRRKDLEEIKRKIMKTIQLHFLKSSFPSSLFLLLLLNFLVNIIQSRPTLMLPTIKSSEPSSPHFSMESTHQGESYKEIEDAWKTNYYILSIFSSF